MTTTRILIVDDDQDFRAMYRDLLGDEGYAVETAATLLDARARIAEDRWDVILLDQKIAETEEPDAGLKLAAECRTKAPSARVLMVTAFASDAAIRRAFDVGVFDYVEKSGVLKTLLLARLRHALDLARERRNASLATRAIEQAIQENWADALATSDANRKGKLLEEVIADLFRTVPGFEQVDVRRKNEIEEIDILVRNGSADELWRKVGAYIVVECKHWSKPVGVDEASRFLDKIKMRNRAQVGFFIAVGGVTQPFRERLALEAAREDVRTVIVLDRDDVAALVEANGGRGELLKRFYDRAVI